MKKSKVRKMKRGELKVISCQKNRKGIATPMARYAQELIWEDVITVRHRFEDDYEGWIDPYDEEYQEYLDYLEFLDCLN